jgi:uncharacterized membrane protein (UPF0136 family)
MFSLVTMGYQVEEIIDHTFLSEKSNDFLEMLLHHIATIALYGGMILNNNINQGVICAWLHMISDVPAPVSKLFSQTRLTVPTVVTFLLVIFSWFFTRLIMITQFTLSTCKYFRYDALF